MNIGIEQIKPNLTNVNVGTGTVADLLGGEER